MFPILSFFYLLQNECRAQEGKKLKYLSSAKLKMTVCSSCNLAERVFIFTAMVTILTC